MCCEPHAIYAIDTAREPNFLDSASVPETTTRGPKCQEFKTRATTLVTELAESRLRCASVLPTNTESKKQSSDNLLPWP
jgi:hypothetical protein